MKRLTGRAPDGTAYQYNSVDADEALVIEWALKDYIEKHRKEYQE